MAQITIKSIPDLVSIIDTNDNDLIIDVKLPNRINDDVAIITVESGSIKFNAFGAASLSSKVYVTDNNLPITIPQDGVIRFQATVQPASFRIEI